MFPYRKYPFLRRVFLRFRFRFHTHTDLRFGFHRRPDNCDCGSLTQGGISRDESLRLHVFAAYSVRHVSLSEIVTPRVRYVVLAAHRVQ